VWRMICTDFYDGARYTAEHIPGARFTSYPTCGHVSVGHQKEVTSEVVALLNQRNSSGTT
jgi:hypothetical protein